MNILAVESSSPVNSCALLKDGRIVDERFSTDTRRHSETLLCNVSEMLVSNHLTVKDITVLAAGAGPGSYTGLRIGAAAIKGLAFPWEIPVAGVSSLFAAAVSIRAAHSFTRIRVIVDAQQDLVYTALFQIENGLPVRAAADGIAPFAGVIAEEDSYRKETLFTGDAVIKYRDELAGSGFTAAGEDGCFPKASAVALSVYEHSQEAVFCPADEFLPNYGREFVPILKKKTGGR